MSAIDDIDTLLAEAEAEAEAETAPPRAGHTALDILLDEANDDPAAGEIDEGDFRALEDEWDTLIQLKERSDKLEALAAKAKTAYTLQKDRMRSAMEAQGTRQFASSAGRGAGSLANEYRTSIEDPEAFMTWVNAQHPELLSVNSQTRDSFIRNEYRDKGIAPFFEDGAPNPAFPPGIRVREQEILRVRNVRPPNQEQQNEQ